MSQAPEFSRLIRPEAVPAGGQRLRLAATGPECAALARRLGLPAIASLEAELRLRLVQGRRVRAEGQLRASVEQLCVVTLEAFAQTVAAPLDFLLLPADEAPREQAPDDDAPDEVECGPQGCDLGEALAQTLSLALDPYPRAPGAAWRVGEGESDGEAPRQPLAAALARLRARE